jgi:hypothetical protein
MRIDSAIITGSFSVNGDTFNDLGVFPSTGSNTFVGNQSIVGAVSASALTGSISYTNLTNVPTLVSGSEQIVGILSPVNSFTSSTTTKINSLEEKTGSLASTGSNTFIGTQTITGSLYISSDLVVQGSSSLQNITASAVSIGTNIVNLNTANPAIRYAGLVIGDSGSIGSSGSFLYDSVQDEMIFVHRGANTTVTSSVVLMGPQTFDGIGNETYLTNNRIPKGAGNEHLADSNISDTGTLVSINSSTSYFSGSVGIGITNPSSTFHTMVAEEQSGLNSVRIQGITNSKLIALGTNTDYTWIQSHGSVPLYINELGNNTIFNLAGGNVGIGTTNPGEKLTINGSIGIQRSGTQIWHTSVDSSNNLQFTRSGIAERMTISSDGLVGIGTTAPSASLHIVSNTPYIYLDDASTSGTKKRFQLLAGDVGSTQTTTLGFNTTSGTSLTEVMALNESGRVGIGTNNPLTTLTVKSTNDNGYGLTRPSDGTTYHWRLSTTETGGDAYTLRYNTFNNEMLFTTYAAGGTGGNIIFRTSGSGGAGSETERLRITPGGLVGIGTTSPAKKLDIYDSNGNATAQLKLRASGNTSAGYLGTFADSLYISAGGTYDSGWTRDGSNGVANIVMETSTDGSAIAFGTAATAALASEKMRITGNGRVGIGITNPSHRLSVSGDFYTSGTQENAGGYYYAQGSTILRKTLNITEGVTTTLLSFDQGGSYGHTGGGEILVVFVDPGSPWGVYVWKGLLTIRTVQFTGAYYGSNLSVVATNSTIDGSFDISATFSKTNGLANGEVRVRVVPGSGIGGTAYVYWNGLVTQGGNAY